MPAPKDRIHKRKDGRYEGRYTVQTPDGPKRKRVYGRKYKEVQRKLAEAMGDAARGLVFNAEKQTVAEYLNRWLTDSVRDTVRRSTFVRYKSIVRHHINPTLGRLKLGRLTSHHIRALYRQKLDDELAPRSVQYIHTTLKKALRQAVLDTLVPRNVCDAVKPPQVHRGEVTPLSPTEVKALLMAASGDRLEALYVVAVYTGLRQGELLGLKWGDLDLDAGKLTVQRSLAFDGTLNLPKRKNSRRTVTLTRTAQDALKRHRARQNEERLGVGARWTDMALVFPNRLGKPMDANNLYHRDWKNLLERAGLSDRGFTFHALRHTFATTLLRQNVNPKIVQHQLGHATISQTMDTYSHVMPDMGDIAADALEAALS
jgi:integrase